MGLFSNKLTSKTVKDTREIHEDRIQRKYFAVIGNCTLQYIEFVENHCDRLMEVCFFFGVGIQFCISTITFRFGTWPP